MEISVVIPLYNKKQTVLRAIESVLAQSYLPQEIIVVNDGSTDGSEKIVQDLNHPLIKLIHQDNGGVSAARNNGITLAEYSWIAFLDGDDEWLPKYLEAIYNLHKTYPDANVLATAYWLQDHFGNRKETILRKLPFNGNHGILTNYFEVAASSDPPLWTSAVVVKKNAIVAVGGFPVGIKSGEDLLTWARLSIKNIIAYSLDISAVYIEDPNNKNISFKRENKKDLVGYRLIKLIGLVDEKNKNDFKKYIGRWIKTKSLILIEIEQYKLARKKIMEGFEYSNEKLKLFLLYFITFLPKKIVNLILKN